MKKRFTKVILSLVLCAVLAITLIPGITAANSTKNLRILFTQDMHSNILPYEILDETGEVVSVGGYARLKTAIDEYSTDSTVLVDAGDYSMGTFFNAVFQTQSPDLTLMGAMGYDATTIGNHEFDYYPEGLKNSLLTATGDNLPKMLISNIVFNDKTQDLKEAFEDYGSAKYTVIDRDGIKIGLFSIIGDQAQDYSGTSDPVEFADVTETAKNCVEKLQEKGVDIIICLSHSGVGTTEDINESEDVILAKNVDGIDIIVSGHSHKVLEESKKVNDTIIVSGGKNAQYLGVLDVTMNDGEVSQSDYKLVEINNSFEEDPEINSMIEKFKGDVNSEYLEELGLTFDQVIGYAGHNFTEMETLLHSYGEYDIANLITDGYLNEVPKTEDYTTVAVINSGIIRNTFLEGEITASDVYNTLSLGIGADGTLGYPLAEFYVTGKELKALCEVDVSVFPILAEAQLFFSGVKYTYNDNRLIFNKVIDVQVQNLEGEWEELKTDETYRVVCSLYMLQMAGLVTDTTHGILSVVPKFQDGTEITDINEAILYYEDGQEIKEWISLVNYISSFETIPDQYDSGREQKISVKTTPITLVESSNTFAIIVYVAVFVILVLIILIIRGIIKKIKKIKHKKIRKRIEEWKNKV